MACKIARKELGTETKSDSIFFSKNSPWIALDLALASAFIFRKCMCLKKKKKIKQFFFIPIHY